MVTQPHARPGTIQIALEYSDAVRGNRLVAVCDVHVASARRGNSYHENKQSEDATHWRRNRSERQKAILFREVRTASCARSREKPGRTVVLILDAHEGNSDT